MENSFVSDSPGNGFQGSRAKLEVGQVLAERYEVLRALGSGGMGLVFAVHDRLLEREVALKCVPQIGDEAGQKRLLREVRALQGLNHEGIVRVFDISRDSARKLHFYTMELAQGESLRKVLARHKDGLPVADLKEIFGKVCSALAYAHGEGVIHRDIKPENIMVVGETVKVIDFGLAKQSLQTSMTQTGVGLGTAIYVAPEQLSGEEVDARADIYSLGMTLYELASGRKPRGFKLLRKLRPEIGALDEVIERCTEQDKAGRYGNVLELARSFAAALDQEKGSGVGVKGADKSRDRGLLAIVFLLIVLLFFLLLSWVLPDSKDAKAQFNLGVKYENGLGVPEDYKAAVQWYRRAAEQGHARAQFNLGEMYSRGRGVPEDDKVAVQWYRRAAEQGLAEAQFNLGENYEYGCGVPQDDEAAVQWYRRAAEQGLAEAQLKLGDMYYWGVTRDYKAAVQWYRRAAEQGLAEAQFNLGVMYRRGRGVAKDNKVAVQWFRRAAEQGLAEAQFMLGRAYEDRFGVPKDYKAAVQWYRRAAEQGLAEAQVNLGLMYANGRGVAKDDKAAVQRYRRAAEQGDASAQYNLGWTYEHGIGVPKDYKAAVQWFRRAAEQGLARAQVNLGLMYANGRGVAKDDKAAVQWYRRAAEQGDAWAQFNLGVMYANGRGVAKDCVYAYMWVYLAVSGGVPFVDALRDFKMTPSQIKKAKKLAWEYVPKPERD